MSPIIPKPTVKITEALPQWRVSLRDTPEISATVRKQYAIEAYAALRALLGVNSFTEVRCEIVDEPAVMTVAPVRKVRLGE